MSVSFTTETTLLLLCVEHRIALPLFTEQMEEARGLTFHLEEPSDDQLWEELAVSFFLRSRPLRYHQKGSGPALSSRFHPKLRFLLVFLLFLRYRCWPGGHVLA